MRDRTLLRLALGCAALAFVALAGCRESGGEGEFFELSGRLFVFNYRVATVRYMVTLKPLRPVGNDEVAVASFENPAGGEAIVVRQKIWPMNDKVTIESPPLECLVKDRPYKVSIVIEDAEGKKKQSIETTMASTQDQSDLPDKPLAVGPFYDPNPELKGHPDGRLPQGRGVTCPPAA
ncbi:MULTISPECIES: hypothetical protein [Hyphomicrobiales]|uniref:hypothetical protein n=1 Tax=Hyphomicrobiales TaxID=356 RepID=UPI0003A312C4|nr:MULTISPECIES: hypothetical protein [Phyllobacteriaceae]MCX8572968.1 hypothetical protein [Aminobacter sp. MET-1]